jgi:RNA polymerase sigma-70 factor, ECF subfamily
MPGTSDTRPPGADQPATDDVALVVAMQRGDEVAFATVLRSHGRQLLATARRMLGNDDDANDALQDAMISAFRAIHGFAGKSKLSTWLHRILVNAVLMKLRSRRHRPERSIEDLLPRFQDDGHHLEPPCPFSDAAVRALQCAESRTFLWRALDELPAAYREVLVLRDIEGMSTEAAGEQLGVTANAVKIRLHRARQALRTLLAAHEDDLS